MKTGAAFVAACLLLVGLRAAEAADTPATMRSAAAKIKIVLAGDSTVLDGSGWGRGFKERLTDDVDCVNLAEPSKSSKTYRTEGFWDKVMAQRGDYVLIQLGANDQPGGGRPDRETDAATEFRANMKRYADEVRAAGGVPILVTPLTRRLFNDDGTIRDTLGDYARATRAASEDAKVPLIDLHARGIALHNALGPEMSKAFAPPPRPGRGPDVSHLNAEGGRAIAALIVEDLVRAVPELAAHVKLPATSQPAPAAARAPKIVLVGDSTVTDKAGWGVGFKSRLTDDVKCVNLAQGGRSSKSYRSEGWWDKAMAERGDYVLIQFGHNDQPGKGPERETDPKRDFPANLKRYVEEARAAGAKPVLVTSLTRRTFQADGTIRDTLGDYAAATRAAAAEAKVPLIDLHARSIALCESLGPEKCKAFDPPPQKDGRPDVSHLNDEGSRAFAALVAEDLVRVAPELAPHVNPPVREAQ